ncbi:hypothetical protein PG987_007754 [Apiospora arundinis]
MKYPVGRLVRLDPSPWTHGMRMTRRFRYRGTHIDLIKLTYSTRRAPLTQILQLRGAFALAEALFKFTRLWGGQYFYRCEFGIVCGTLHPNYFATREKLALSEGEGVSDVAIAGGAAR